METFISVEKGVETSPRIFPVPFFFRFCFSSFFWIFIYTCLNSVFQFIFFSYSPMVFISLAATVVITMLCRLFVLSGRIFLILHRLIQHIPPRKYKSLSIYLTSSENLFMLSIFQNFDSKNNNTSTSNDKELCLAVGEMRDSWVRCRPVDYLLFHVIFLSFVLLKKLHWL